MLQRSSCFSIIFQVDQDQYPHNVEASLLIFIENQLTGFHVMEALTLNWCKNNFLVVSLGTLHIL